MTREKTLELVKKIREEELAHVAPFNWKNENKLF